MRKPAEEVGDVRVHKDFHSRCDDCSGKGSVISPKFTRDDMKLCSCDVAGDRVSRG